MSNTGTMSNETEFIKTILQDNHLVIGILEKLKNYHYLNIKEIIEKNTNKYSVFHYGKTNLIADINNISYWVITEISSEKSAVINSNREIILPFDYYDYIETETNKNIKYISCCYNNENLLYDFNGNLVKGEYKKHEQVPCYIAKNSPHNKFTENIVEVAESMELPEINQFIKYIKENLEIVKENTLKMEESSLKHSIFDYSYSEFFTNRQNKRFFCLKDRQTNKQGLAGAKGNLVVPFKYDFCSGFGCNNLNYIYTGIITKEGERYGLTDCLGNDVIEPVSERPINFSEGYATIRQNGKYGYINSSGDIVIPIIYDKADDFVFAKAKVELNGEKFYINRLGKRIEE